ncbi:MAG: hypothetical protein V1895_00940 [Parcubacteria group bacterium]
MVREIKKQLSNEIGSFLRFVIAQEKKADRELYIMRAIAQGQSHISVSRAEGSIILVGDEYLRFRKIINELQKVHEESESYDLKFAENTLIEGILTAVEDKSDEGSWKKGLQKVQMRYSQELTEWKVFIPVSGIIIDDAHWQFGKIVFYKKSDPFFASIVGADNTKNDIFAYIIINAVDSSEAEVIAKQEVEYCVSIINGLMFLSGSIEPGEALSSYGEVGSTDQSWVYVSGKSTRKGSRKINYRFAGFHPAAFQGSEIARIFSAKVVSDALREASNDLFNKRIMPSLKWLGRVSLQASREEAFLFIFLALEAIIFETNFNQQVTSRIKTRLCKLLFTEGRFFHSSVNAMDSFEDLYRMRSNIIHRGGQVRLSAKDIFLAEDLVRGCLYKFFQDGIFKEMSTSSDLEEWLNRSLKEPLSFWQKIIVKLRTFFKKDDY